MLDSGRRAGWVVRTAGTIGLVGNGKVFSGRLKIYPSSVNVVDGMRQQTSGS